MLKIKITFLKTEGKSGKIIKNPSKAEQIKLKPPSVFQLGFCDPGREEAIQHNCLVELPGTPLSAAARAFSRVVSLTSYYLTHSRSIEIIGAGGGM